MAYENGHRAVEFDGDYDDLETSDMQGRLFSPSFDKTVEVVFITNSPDDIDEDTPSEELKYIDQVREDARRHGEAVLRSINTGTTQ